MLYAVAGTPGGFGFPVVAPVDVITETPFVNPKS